MAGRADQKTTSIVSPPRAGDIYWSAHATPDGDSEPLDPLRFNMYAQRLGNVLLPGITERTSRVRYLAMVCAGLQVTQAPGMTVKERRRAFLPFERGWALAIVFSAGEGIKYRPGGDSRPRLKPEYDGFRGANRVLAHYRSVQNEGRISPTKYTLLRAQESQGGLGAYLVMLRHYQLVHRETLALTAEGRALADAFRASSSQRLSDLVAPEVSRTRLRGAGADLTLAHLTPDERELSRTLLFGGAAGMSEVIRRMRLASGDRLPSTAAEGVQSIADPKGDLIGRSAHYAVCFDPMRRALGKLFAGLGRRLEGRAAAQPIDKLADDEMEAASNDARAAANRLASCTDIGDLEPVSALARDIANADHLAGVVRETVAFHRREGRAWILEQGGDRYIAGRHGAFDDPADRFHGYTVPSALRLLADCEATL